MTPDRRSEAPIFLTDDKSAACAGGLMLTDNILELIGNPPLLRIEGNVAGVLPDRAERYFSTALM